MRTARIGLVAVGVLLLGLGAFRLVTQLARGDLVTLGVWLVLAVALHDLVIAPATVGVGAALTLLPARARRYAQGACVVAAMITVIAIPLIRRRNTQPAIKAILLRDYAGNLALLLGLTVAVAVVLYLLRVLRDGSAAGERDVAD